MSVTVTTHGAHPLIIAGLTLDGFHRPINGEVANLTVTLAHGVVLPDWLAQPPLGIGCTVAYGEDVVMDGALHGVRVNASAVQLRIEG